MGKPKERKSCGVCPYRYQECLNKPEHCSVSNKIHGIEDPHEWARKASDGAEKCSHAGVELSPSMYQRRQKEITEAKAEAEAPNA
jgi:hypothetical protein